MDIHGLDTTLKAMPFFQGMSDEQLRIIAGCARNATFQIGDYLFKYNDPAQNFWILREGKVAVEIGAADRDPLIIQTVGDGEVIGWSWLFEPYIWTFDARVIEPVRALAFDGRCLRGKCDDDHEIGYELLTRFSSIVVERLQATRLQVCDIYS